MAGNLWTIVNILVDRPHAQLRMIATVREVILQDRRQTLHNVFNRVELSQGNVNAF
jgi:hypothetical protein